MLTIYIQQKETVPLHGVVYMYNYTALVRKQ